MREVVHLAPWLLAAVAFAVALGLLGAWLLSRMTGVDTTTAFFATAIGGASEMATQAQRHGGRIDRVAAAHSLRIMLVVLIVPLALNAFGVHGVDPYTPLARSFDLIGFAVLCAVTLGAAVAMARLGSPNSWMIGPLLAAAAITATGHTFSSLPTPVINGGQTADRNITRRALHARIFPSGSALPHRRFAHHDRVPALQRGLRLRTRPADQPAVADGGGGDHARRYRRDGTHRAGTAAWRADRDGIPCNPDGCCRDYSG